VGGCLHDLRGQLDLPTLRGLHGEHDFVGNPSIQTNDPDERR
jgi:hypothetical protein